MNRFMHDRVMQSVLLLGVLAVLMSGCATNPVTGEQDFVLMSEDQELALGKQSNKQIMQQYTEYENPELQSLVQSLGEQIANQSHRSNLVFHFTVLDSPEVNAFALPGGYVFITRGIIAYMNSEEELAGVLGHEIGHVTARHSVRQHSASTLTGLAGVAAAVITGSREVAQLSNQVGGAMVRGYGRKHELEADRLGAEYLARTGYSPEKMLDVIAILKNQEEFEIQRAREEGREPRNYHGVFSTHPDNDQRLQEVIMAAEKFRVSQATLTKPENFLALLDGMTFGSSESQGIVRGSRFYHRDLDFTIEFPANWRIENQPTQLLAIRKDNEAVIRLQIDDMNRKETPRDYAHRTFKNLQQGEKVGEQAYTGLVKGNTPFGEGWVRVAAIFHDKQIFIMSGAASGDLPHDDFLHSLNSVRHLVSAEQELAKTRKIKLVQVRDGETFEKLARNSDLGQYGEEKLRLLNGMYPEGQPISGQTVKIIQ